MKILFLSISTSICLFASTLAVAQVTIATTGKFKLNVNNNTVSTLTISNVSYENIIDNAIFDNTLLDIQGTFDFIQQTSGQSPTELDFQIHDNNAGICYMSISLTNGKWWSNASPCCSGDLRGTILHVDNASLNNGLIDINVT